MTETEVPLVPGRECGTCTMCCEVLRIEALDSVMIVFPLATEKRLTVHVDPARAEALQPQPYAADLANWALAIGRMGRRLSVVVGSEEVAVLEG